MHLPPRRLLLGSLLALALPLGLASPLAQRSLAGTRHAQRVAAPQPGDPITQPRAAQPPPAALTPPPPAPRHDPPADLTPPAASSAGTPVPYPTADPQDAARLAAERQATPRPVLTPAHYPTADPQDAALLAAQHTATPTH